MYPRLWAYFLCTLAYVIFLIAPPAFALDKEDITESGVTHSSVENTLSGILAEDGGGRYSYREGSLEDPPWVTAFRNWLKRVQDRWNSSGGPAGDSIRLFNIWIAVSFVVLVLVVLYFIARILGFKFVGKQDPVKIAIENGDVLIGTWGEEGARKAIEFASAGKFRDAISLLFRSSLRGLDHSGWIRYRKSGGSRHYLRQLRVSESLYPLFREMLGRFEIAFYKNDQTYEDDWTFLYDKYQDLARTAVAVKPIANTGRM